LSGSHELRLNGWCRASCFQLSKLQSLLVVCSSRSLVPDISSEFQCLANSSKVIEEFLLKVFLMGYKRFVVLRESLTKVVIILELFLADFIKDIVTGVRIKHKSCEFFVSWLLAMVERPWLKSEYNTTGKFPGVMIG
jgi:hypothetical protein